MWLFMLISHLRRIIIKMFRLFSILVCPCRPARQQQTAPSQFPKSSNPIQQLRGCSRNGTTHEYVRVYNTCSPSFGQCWKRVKIAGCTPLTLIRAGAVWCLLAAGTFSDSLHRIVTFISVCGFCFNIAQRKVSCWSFKLVV